MKKVILTLTLATCFVSAPVFANYIMVQCPSYSSLTKTPDPKAPGQYNLSGRLVVKVGSANFSTYLTTLSSFPGSTVKQNLPFYFMGLDDNSPGSYSHVKCAYGDENKGVSLFAEYSFPGYIMPNGIHDKGYSACTTLDNTCFITPPKA